MLQSSFQDSALWSPAQLSPTSNWPCCEQEVGPETSWDTLQPELLCDSVATWGMGGLGTKLGTAACSVIQTKYHNLSLGLLHSRFFTVFVISLWTLSNFSPTILKWDEVCTLRMRFVFVTVHENHQRNLKQKTGINYKGSEYPEGPKNSGWSI